MATKRYIVIHHSATPDGVVAKDFDTLKKNHLAIGYRDIGYHWVIEKVNGALTAIPGRAEWDTGAHCPGRNEDGIGVCCIGNFEIDTPSDELYRFTAALCRSIMGRHPIQEIGMHRDYYPTLCAGQNFDINKLKKYIAEEDQEEMQDVKVIVIDKELTGKLIDGVTYVPVRDVVDGLNMKVLWDETSKTAVIKQV